MQVTFARRAILVIALALGACDASPAHDSARRAASSAGTAPAQARPSGVSPRPSSSIAADPLAGLDCKPARAGFARECRNLRYDVTGFAEACTNDSAAFGAIAASDPVGAFDRLGEAGRRVATLAPGQFVCSYYSADPRSSTNDGWLYVVAIPPSLLSACRSRRCGDPAARSRWDAGNAGACRMEGKRYAAGCPAGWVRRADVDEYSMGL
jgi:hypothetical protein